MINFNALQEVREFVPSDEMPFLRDMREKVQDEKPYRGVRILHNIPLTIEAVFKVEPLILGGADVVVSGIKQVPPSPLAVGILMRAGVPLALEKNPQESFDIHLDCCAELAEFKAPRLGAVELTQTGAVIYQHAKTSYPVVSVDDSSVKRLEGLGTGIGFVEAFEELTKANLVNRNIVVMGCGKVGWGVVRALQPHTSHVVIIEKDRQLVKHLRDLRYHALHIDEERPAVNQVLSKAFCVVTATGVIGCISQSFEKHDFADIPYLANLGADDEYGDKFAVSDVLFNKIPINFAIPRPTPLIYLDPVFYAHNVACDMLIKKQIAPGFQVFPEFAAQDILKKWELIHNEKLDELNVLHEEA